MTLKNVVEGVMRSWGCSEERVAQALAVGSAVSPKGVAALGMKVRAAEVEPVRKWVVAFFKRVDKMAIANRTARKHRAEAKEQGLCT